MPSLKRILCTVQWLYDNVGWETVICLSRWIALRVPRIRNWAEQEAQHIWALIIRNTISKEATKCNGKCNKTNACCSEKLSSDFHLSLCALKTSFFTTQFHSYNKLVMLLATYTLFSDYKILSKQVLGQVSSLDRIYKQKFTHTSFTA